MGDDEINDLIALTHEELGLDWDEHQYEWSDPFSNQPTAINDIILTGGGEEMIKVTKEGFYIRGVLVPQDSKEAQKVYQAFKQWLTWKLISGDVDK
jgi:hypothetical protein